MKGLRHLVGRRAQEIEINCFVVRLVGGRFVFQYVVVGSVIIMVEVVIFG